MSLVNIGHYVKWPLIQMIQGKFSGDGFGGRASRLSRDLLQIWTASSQQIAEKVTG